MATTSDSSVSFEETDTRDDEMNSTIEQWIDDLVAGVDDAQASAEFQEWLDVQSRFHDYSYRNTLLIKRQCPEATRVAGYRTWQEEFDRHVKEDESAIWIWAPIITKQCPECENSPSYHEDSDCDYDETPPEKWSKGLVGFKPTPVFDVSQTEGEPLPDLDTEATGDASDLVPQLTETADELGVTVQIVPDEEWTHGEAKGICEQLSLLTYSRLSRFVIEKTKPISHGRWSTSTRTPCSTSTSTTTLSGRNAKSRPKPSRTSSAGTAGSTPVGRRSTSAAWESDDPAVVRNRLDRISRTAEEIIDIVDEVMEDE